MNSIRFYNVDFFSEYADVIDFPSPARRDQYFTSKFINIETENIQIVKPPYSYVKVTGDYNEFQQVNYCIFTLEVTTNGETSTRDYYCFVDRVDYAGVGVVGLALSLDVWQTTLFNADGSAGFELEECHVERGHVDVLTAIDEADVKYLQTPEQVDTGAEVYTGSLFDPTQRVNLGGYTNQRVGYAYIQSTEPIATIWGDPVSGMFPNIAEPIAYMGLSTLYTYVVPVILNQVVAQEAPTKLYAKAAVAGVETEKLFPTLLELYTALKGEPAVVDISVTNVFPVDVSFSAGETANSLLATPSNTGTQYVQAALFNLVDTPIIGLVCWIPVTIPGLNTANEYSFSASNGSIADPDIVKTLVFPFKFYKITNNKVGDYIVKPQYLGSVKRSQDLTLCVRIAPSGTGSLVTSYYINGYLNGNAVSPFHYGDELNAPENNISGSLPLMTDEYKNYMSSSKASMQAGLASKAISGFVGLAAGGVGTKVASVVGLIGSFAQTAAHIQDLQDTPQTIRGNGQNLNISALAELLGVIVWQCSASRDMRERAHEYFRRFGYTVGENIKYNTKSRQLWNYVKTSDAVISTNFGTYYSQELRRIFNAGVRIWHYPDSATGSGWHGVGVYKDDDGDNYINSQVAYAQK